MKEQKDQLIQLQQRADNLADKLSTVTTMADQVSHLLKSFTQDDSSPVLVVRLDQDGDFMCEMYGESITLLNPEDVVKMASWIGATIQCDDAQVEEELQETAQRMGYNL